MNSTSGEIKITGKKPIELIIRTTTNLPVEAELASPVFKPNGLPLDILSPYIRDLYEQAGKQISYLIASRKTSSFEYGTILIETAQLGVSDLSTETIDFIR